MSTPDADQSHAPDQSHEPAESDAPPPGPPSGPTPAARARRARIAAASLLMGAAAVVLALRLASRSSVLVVGVYGLLLILCGGVIELSRRGRTRLGTWLLAAGLAAALVMDGVVLS
ncbi:hypothetical protein DMA15_13310 [Streptomyces sp. WAC 01529]|uniref:hypothetical protein n=1 Tax=Streptomyces sp. WAC 01529 TaxID=2203205 RepID=UPI000F6D89A4|nr:hypothetical protein [Streptomyces sp. WAC 01529]AZM53439.1 hypothetical protein DMA15_13310 [Streptomyces sp. WAC 01529]